MRIPLEPLSRARFLSSVVWLPLLLGLATPVGSTAAVGASTALAGESSEAATAARILSSKVVNPSHPAALEIAFEAYYRYREDRPDAVRKPYLYFVDLGLDNRTPRGYVFDMDRLEVVDGPFAVAHGRGSSTDRDAIPTRFSNTPGSLTSSLGVYLALETYTFRGRAGGKAYASVGLRLRGESDGFNDAAAVRGIVVHGAPYVTATVAGRSEGCPAMEPERAERLLPLLADGGVVFIYSPNDARWLEEEPWLRTAPRMLTASRP